MPSSSNTSGDKGWFVVLMEDGCPVRAYPWDDWADIQTEDRPENCYLTIAKDEMDAFGKALRGEILDY